MTTPVLARPVTGAPYQSGDFICVEVDDQWVDCVTVVSVRLSTLAPRFGLRWVVEYVHPFIPHTVGVRNCDDNGRNHTWRQQLTPSFHTPDEDLREDPHDGYTGVEL